MLNIKEFNEHYAKNNCSDDNINWEMSKPIGGMPLKQRIKDAWNVLINRGVVVSWK